ncbi:helix-turn-helix transcriptional regulator [Holdemanella biformis]|uniref:helix-turn-helix domain-containing protein n=1 Tax=Holdemanella biformis TaxID=1735 RepID=UPI00242BDB9D|nr:helix-turn-helix transcriptional regulator [Holdemanella biformis]MBS6257236.1 helix-turn-helix transcriptional regulator [Holdemanella biformis]
MELHERLKQLRKEKKLTQKELANALNIPYRTLLNWELNTRKPSYENMIKMQEFFNVSGAYLRGETDIKEAMTWDDPEIMDEVEKQLISSMKALSNLAIAQTDANKKILFNFFVEFRGLAESLESNDDFYLLTETMINNFNTLERIIRHSKSSQD